MEEILNFIRLDTDHIREKVKKEFHLIRILLGKMEEIVEKIFEGVSFN